MQCSKNSSITSSARGSSDGSTVRLHELIPATGPTKFGNRPRQLQKKVGRMSAVLIQRAVSDGTFSSRKFCTC